jgi:hypothetical protein
MNAQEIIDTIRETTTDKNSIADALMDGEALLAIGVTDADQQEVELALEIVMQAPTYTLAFNGDLMVACIPDGADMQSALDNYDDVLYVSDVAITTGVTLTNTMPDDESSIIHSGHECGWLTNANGSVSYDYAIKQV